MEGWIRLNRSIQNHWLWKDEPFDKARAWIDLLMLANYEDKKIAYKGEIITCKRGDVNLSISFLANRWKWDRKTVRKFLKLLESDGMVTTKSTTHRTTITIENYGVYQDMGTTKGTTKFPTKSQQTPQQSPTTKEINNVNNINNNTSNELFDEVVNIYNSVCISLPKITVLSEKRKNAITKVFLKDKTIKPDEFESLCKKVESSDFLTSRKGSWKASFDWVMNSTNIIKVLEGNYENRGNNNNKNAFNEMMHHDDYNINELEALLNETQ